MKNKLFVIVAVLIAAVAFMILKSTSKQETPKPIASPKVPGDSKELFIRAHSPTMGNSLARVTVVQWFDPECESCRKIHPIFKKIVEDYKDRVNFVLRYMPYHQHSMFAASALEEAREMNKFEEALDILFEKQPEWGDHHNPKPELIATFLMKIGMPEDKLDQAYLIQKHGSKIRQDEEDGNLVGVRGTPTFFVNGQMVQGLGDEVLRAAIDKALAETNAQAANH